MRAVAVTLAVVFVGCGDTTPATPAPGPTPQPWSDAWLLAQGASYLGDVAARRAALEAALANPANMYSRIRLAAYGLGNHGWDLLPVWNPRSIPVTEALMPALARGETP